MHLRKTPSSLLPKNDEESHHLTHAPAVSTYPASSSKVACRFSINARIIATRILDSSGPCHCLIHSISVTMHTPTYPSNSWATSRLRESTEPLAPLFIPTLITQVQLLSERLPVEDINRKRSISLYSYASRPKLYT